MNSDYIQVLCRVDRAIYDLYRAEDMIEGSNIPLEDRASLKEIRERLMEISKRLWE